MTERAYINPNALVKVKLVTDETDNQTDGLPEAAKRALAEAEARRQAAKDLELPPELGGRDGPEPVRFGDWEKKGIAIDF